ncbi:hypothetical protein EYZ11_012133 [Aspergillus tanneri]|uniref:Uncharacterized protein n=1 Tax=Aspergillus tanneri TaxID=1220188 RepID=A0A4S3J113_9EURO|nr:hypothetical protein EYZ11_012133 [Aspergillus tanneri]
MSSQRWQGDAQTAGALSTKGSSGQTSTPGVSADELVVDSDFVVKIPDAARAAAAKKTVSAALSSAVVTAACQLPSGDIRLRASSAAATKVLRKYAEA